MTYRCCSNFLIHLSRTIRNQLKDSVFIEGVHYIRPFGGRKILFVWERIETEMLKFTGLSMDALQ
ncbi:hypothetical protein FGQ54_09445 [Acinetobacter lwoffii]|nr:hypothetical protein FGQ54_09445 [Acinetobacter lwoffii]